MALTDEEKLQVSVEAFQRKLDRIETWTVFKTLVQNITKVQVVNFIKNALANSADSYRTGATDANASADDLDNLVDEYDVL